MQNAINNTPRIRQYNTCQRCLFIDILKTIALILMPIIHSFSMLDICGYFGDQLAYSIKFQMSILYLIVPGVFMFCMGAGIVLSEHSSPKYHIKRGLKLLLIALIFNIFRGLCACAVCITNNEPFIETFIYWLLGSDILQFAGLFFLLYGVLKKIKFNDIAIFIVSIIMLIVSTLIAPVNIENGVMQEIVGNIIYVNSDSYFPLLSWSIFPASGIIFMRLFKNSKSKNKFMFFTLIIAAFTLAITICNLIFMNIFNLYYILWELNDFYMNFIAALINISIILIYQAVIFWIAKLIKTNTLIRFFTKTSINIIIIYLTHWILIAIASVLLVLLVDTVFQSGIIVYVSGIIIFIISWIIANLLTKNKTKTKPIQAKHGKI